MEGMVIAFTGAMVGIHHKADSAEAIQVKIHLDFSSSILTLF